ncbi:MAG: hypothetical protein C0392_13620 [Syntrophus sp. (in: bacteria)]|nr:hypothetical protein [Syntrophus sp. (in: bacteria)]
MTPCSRGFYISPVRDSITSAILASMSDGVLVFNFNGHIVFSNEAALNVLHLQKTEVIGKRYVDLFMVESENDAFNDILFSGIQNKETHTHSEVTFRRSDGEKIDLAVTTSFLHGKTGAGEKEGIVVVFKDITQLKALDRARKRVVDHLSHELKTPLAIIRATLKRVSQPENVKLVERMSQNLERLQDIQLEVEDIIREVNVKEEKVIGSLMEQTVDLLDIVAEKNELYRKPIELLKEEVRQLFDIRYIHSQPLETGTSVCELCDRVETLALNRQVALRRDVEGNPKIWIDPDTMSKVLMAPVKNALEATPEGGEVVVSLRARDGLVVIEIRDTGVGITPESQKQIFGGFYHAKDTDYYTTKKPFDFGAGGKGLDLLRLKILSKVYNFRIEWESRRCPFIPKETDLCPGSISACTFVQSQEECARSGGTTFRLLFPRL